MRRSGDAMMVKAAVEERSAWARSGHREREEGGAGEEWWEERMPGCPFTGTEGERGG
jgi:hypothetical protein